MSSSGIVSILETISVRPRLVTAAEINLDMVYEINDGHSYELLYGDARYFPTDNPLLKIGNGKVVVGMIWHHDSLVHPGEAPRKCSGEIAFVAEKDDPKPYVWAVHSLAPLSVSPSLNCSTCYSHGFLRHGHYDELGTPNRHQNYMYDPDKPPEIVVIEQGAISTTQLRLDL